MTDLLEVFDITRSFWECNPAFQAIKEFKSLYKKDRSANKRISSSLMWAISLLVHPKSRFSNATFDERLDLINSDFLNNKQKLDPEKDHKELIFIFQKLAMTRTQRIARQWGDKLDERFKFIDSMPYTYDNVDTLDKMMASTEKLWKQYQVCLKDLEEENAASQVIGGAAESLSEQNKI